MRAARSAALLLVACAAPVLAEEPATPPPDPLVLADFEDEAALGDVRAVRGSCERVPDGPDGTSHALRWTLEPNDRSSFLSFRLPASPAIARARTIRLRIRTEGARAGDLFLRIEDGVSNYLGARLRGAAAEWTTLSLDVEDMDREGGFALANAKSLSLIVFDSREGTYLLDDVVLDPSPPAPPAPEPAAKSGKKGPRRAPVADFEREGLEEWVEVSRSEAARVPAGGKEKGHVLEWTIRPGQRASYLELYGGPRSVKPFRTLRFRVRADPAIAQELYVRLETTIDDFIGTEVKGLGPAWKTIELPLPEMRTFGTFDAGRVRAISFTLFEPEDAAVRIDDVEFEEGPGGWRFTPAEMTVRHFGEDRARKVRKIPTKHFDIQTDSTAASSKFPGALEKAYEFVKTTLGHAEMEEKLPVFIFQNPTLYADFTVKSTGWTREEAENTAGHGSGEYFATYYQAPEAPTVVHELTHSIFHRTVGAWGGSWLQEGVAVFVENAWQGRSAAAEFSPALRGGKFLKLREFLALRTLVAEDDPKGGARTAGRLYLQAGAFFEFLRRGPIASQAEKLIPELARAPAAAAEMPERVEKAFGKKLEEIEQEWIAWGSKPPKTK